MKKEIIKKDNSNKSHKGDQSFYFLIFETPDGKKIAFQSEFMGK